MNKLKYGVLGLLFGLIASPVVWIVACIFLNEDDFSVSCIFSAIVGLIIGVIVGNNIDKEVAEAELREQQRLRENARRQLEQEEAARQKETQQRETNLLNNWRKGILLSTLNAFNEIKLEIDWKQLASGKHGNQPLYNQQEVDKCLERLEALKKDAAERTRNSEFVSYTRCLENDIRDYTEKLKTQILKSLQNLKQGKFDGHKAVLWKSFYRLLFITQDKRYLTPALAAYHFVCGTYESVTHVELNDYGNLIVPLDTDEKMQKIATDIAKIQSKIEQSISQIKLKTDDYFTDVEKMLYPEITTDAELVMWYYARKKPFDTESFEYACQLYGRFTHYKGNSNFVEMTARIFSKKEIGGEKTVESDRKTIENWIDSHKDDGYNDDGQFLASALAWMELYRLELNVLQQLVQQRVQLNKTVQERLKFLSEGGTSNIKVYDIPESDSDKFMYDSSSKDWDDKSLSICFRNMKMKRITPHYSLLISSWSKTLPLSSGQKVSKEQLYQNFSDMLEDFDGELTCRIVTAKAVDLANVEYPNAVLFQFTTERNRCISMLFHYEKFGRNLNITILTFFTPEAGLSFEDMEKYAVAIKSNMYVQGFCESILQEVDKALKEEVTIYNDDEPEKKKVFFE